ncbi:DUF3592 domain-containing protein [Variovorax paradoxus]|uniref:DUF3592 domain-containing protein n=1 Tax=Variovorax paradoxus TaxID=34073 RepID=UPI00018C0FF4|nr:DUF3592 domain-containing protein [Variovorax paradoxus]
MSWWNILAATLCLGLCGIAGVFGVHVIVSSYAANARYMAEEKTWQALRGQGVRAQGVVVGISRQANRLTKNGNYGNNEVAATDLLLAYEDAAGNRHEVTVATFIELGLLANFSVGKKIDVIYARDAPDRVAIDRERTPLEIPSSAY